MAKRLPERVAVVLLCTAAHAGAQDLGTQDLPTVTVVPRVSVSETFTDNVGLSATDKRADQITEVSPGIRITANTPRVQGYLDYALRAVDYAQTSRSDNYLNALSTAAQVEAVDQWMFVDVSGTIAQQSVSAFDPVSGQSTYASANTSEVASYRVSPFVRGRLGNLANYVARYSRAIRQSNAAAVSGVGESRGSAELSNDSALGSLGWVLDASRYTVDYSAGRPTESDQVDAGVSYAFTPQFRAVVKAGREASNYTTREKQTYDTTDAGVTWQPSPQTQASANWGRRAFGDTRALNLEHRTALAVVRLADRRDVAAVPGLVLPVLLIPEQGAPVIGTLTTTALSLQNRQDLFVTLLGVRDTVTLAVSQSESTRIDTLSGAQDELARSALHQAGLSVSLVHRLTPRYAFTVIAGQQKAWSDTAQDSWLRELSISLGGRVAKNGSASVGVRRAVASGTTSYDETALTFNLTVEF